MGTAATGPAGLTAAGDARLDPRVAGAGKRSGAPGSANDYFWTMNGRENCVVSHMILMTPPPVALSFSTAMVS